MSHVRIRSLFLISPIHNDPKRNYDHQDQKERP
jgi:hypothetical protein